MAIAGRWSASDRASEQRDLVTQSSEANTVLSPTPTKTDTHQLGRAVRGGVPNHLRDATDKSLAFDSSIGAQTVVATAHQPRSIDMDQTMGDKPSVENERHYIPRPRPQARPNENNVAGREGR